MIEPGHGPAERAGAACAPGMDFARNGILFAPRQLLGESWERAAVREPPRKAGP